MCIMHTTAWGSAASSLNLLRSSIQAAGSQKNQHSKASMHCVKNLNLNRNLVSKIKAVPQNKSFYSLTSTTLLSVYCITRGLLFYPLNPFSAGLRKYRAKIYSMSNSICDDAKVGSGRYLLNLQTLQSFINIISNKYLT